VAQAWQTVTTPRIFWALLLFHTLILGWAMHGTWWAAAASGLTGIAALAGIVGVLLSTQRTPLLVLTSLVALVWCVVTVPLSFSPLFPGHIG
jgi:hypothetical protein